MPDYAAEPNTNTGPAGIRQVGLACLALLLGLTLVWTGFNSVMPKVSDEGQGKRMRIGWYLRSGQWQADVRTLAAAIHYIMTPDESLPSVTNSPTNQLAAVSQPGSNPTSISALKHEPNRLPSGRLPHRGDS